MSAVRDAELAALIAEQEADDRLDYQPGWQKRVSLDAPLSHDTDGVTLADVIGAEDENLAALLGEDEAEVRIVTRRRGATAQEVASWRWARTRRKWTYEQIGEHFGVPWNRVHYYLSKPERRYSESLEKLKAKLPFAKAAYEKGARLMEIAEELYEETGYASAASCRQALYHLFVEENIPRRWRGRYKHGARSRDATPEQQRQYRDAKNAELRHQGLTCTRKRRRPCPAMTRHGRRCRRLAIDGSEFCMTHGLPHPTQKWTRENIGEALLAWTTKYGEPPVPSDWRTASEEHPTCRTVYDLFDGGWREALLSVGLTARRKPLARDERGRILPKQVAA